MRTEEDIDALANRAAAEFKSFVKTIAQLRDPKTGCPWDLQQTHESLRRYMIEEAYEAAVTMLGPVYDGHLLEELGDVLLQVVLNAQLARDDGRGDIAQIIAGINQKMIRRHPHVFNPTSEAGITSEEVKKRWGEIKAAEKGNSGKVPSPSVFSEAEKVQPALSQSFKIGKIAGKIDFDWAKPSQVLEQLRSELRELETEMDHLQSSERASDRRRDLADELSDCMFTLAQLCRHLNFEPEDIAHRGNSKFLQRFAEVERLAKEKGWDVTKIGQDKLEELWKVAKAR